MSSSPAGSSPPAPIQASYAATLVPKSNGSLQTEQQQEATQQQRSNPRRIRGRRSSKPAMEKRRRARMNQSLDELKFYVLNDQNNLRRLGIDASSIENMDEETVARTMLKSSGLIHRHRGRKNPNKLEKADILELTVDYVRMLLKQNEQLLAQRGDENTHRDQLCPLRPLSLSLPLTDQARLNLQTIPPSPPNSLDSSGSPTPHPTLICMANNRTLVHMDTDASCNPLDLRSYRK